MIISLENRGYKCTNCKTKKATAELHKGETAVVLQLFCLICRDAISQDFIVAKGVTASCAAVTSIAFDGIDSAIFDLFYNTNVVRQTVLRTGLSVGRIPVKENNHTRGWLEASVSPLATRLEPVDAVDATGKLGNDADVNISTLVSTPANKASTPGHARSKTVPTPVRHTTYITDLGNSDGCAVWIPDLL